MAAAAGSVGAPGKEKIHEKILLMYRIVDDNMITASDIILMPPPPKMTMGEWKDAMAGVSAPPNRSG